MAGEWFCPVVLTLFTETKIYASGKKIYFRVGGKAI